MRVRVRKARARLRAWWYGQIGGCALRPGPEAGQTTAEYALVIVAAAALAALLLVWASSSGSIGRLFNAVFDRVLDQFG